MSIQIIRTPQPPEPFLDQIAQLLQVEGIPAQESVVRRRARNLPREDRILMAVEGDLLLGFAHLRIARDLTGDESAEVASIVVRNSHRRRGIGRMLVTAAETWARQSGRARLLLRTAVVRTAAHAFYLALGYQETSTNVEFVRDLGVERRADAPTLPPPDLER